MKSLKKQLVVFFAMALLFGLAISAISGTYALPNNASSIAPERIEVSSQPDKLSYDQGEPLDLTGMTVTAYVYSAGENAPQTITDYTTVPANGAILNSTGTQTVTVNYQGLTTSLTIEVEPSQTDSATVDVRNASELKAAIDANDNIRLMGDVVLPSSWVASGVVYSGTFDGNGFSLKGDGGTMTEPVFRKTDNAIFTNVKFVDFKMTRDKNQTENTVGALVDHFDNSKQIAAMTNCYLEGTFTVICSIGDVLDETGQIWTYVGPVAGYINAQEVRDVKALMNCNIQFVDPAWNRSPSPGGLFGTVYTNHFEGNEVLHGSSITVNSRYFGGLAMGIAFPSEGGDIINCNADYTLINQMDSVTGQIMCGGMFRRINNVRLMDGCTVKCNLVGSPNRMTLFGGIACVEDQNIEEHTFSNCSVTFTGDIVDTDMGAGILSSNPNVDVPTKTINFINCSATVNMRTGSGGAGIFMENGFNNIASGYNINIVNCHTNGSITATYANTLVGGIAIAGPTNAQSGVIENCDSGMALNNVGYGYGNVRIGGIWANRSGRNTANVMTVKNCLYTGVADVTGGDSTVRQIFNCDPGDCTGINNFTYAQGYTDAAGPDGQSITTAAPVLESIEVTNQPTKVDYSEGDALNLSGLAVSAVYSNGSAKDLTTYTTDPANGAVLNAAGTQIVSVSYTEDGVTKTTSFTVTVKAAPPVTGQKIIVSGVELDYDIINGVAIIKPTQAQMAAILNAPGNVIVLDFKGTGLTAIDIQAPAAWFKDYNKTITIATDSGACSVKTKTLWNNSGKDRLIQVRNNTIGLSNVK